MPFMVFDPLYMIIFFVSIVLAGAASAKVHSTFSKWKRVRNASGMSGAEAAHVMLHRAGLTDVRVEETHGLLSDHYDPRHRVLRLSREVYQGRSVASIGVALHEAGHALQHAQNYAPLSMRSALVPVIGMGGSHLPFILILIGLFMKMYALAYAGLILFGLVVLFSLVTLPVEFNASTRAKRAAVDLGVVSPGREASGVSAVLNAAAMTYVAGAVTALLQLLYFALLVFGGRRS